MSRNQFRLFVLGSVFLALFPLVYEIVWPDETVIRVYEFLAEIEPEVEYSNLYLVGIIAGAVMFASLASLAGLLLFKSWARHVYVSLLVFGFCLYPLIGISVENAYSQMIYDGSVLMSGALIVLIYYSPVAQYFE